MEMQKGRKKTRIFWTTISTSLRELLTNIRFQCIRELVRIKSMSEANRKRSHLAPKRLYDPMVNLQPQLAAVPIQFSGKIGASTLTRTGKSPDPTLRSSRNPSTSRLVLSGLSSATFSQTLNRRKTSSHVQKRRQLRCASASRPKQLPKKRTRMPNQTKTLYIHTTVIALKSTSLWLPVPCK